MAATSFAQQQIGVTWQLPDSRSEARNQIEQFRDLGIQTILVNGKIDPAQMNLLESYGMGLYAALPFEYLTSTQIYRVDTTMVNLFAEYLNHYHPYSYLKGISLLAHGATQDSLFRLRLRGIKQVLAPYATAPILIEGTIADLPFVKSIDIDGVIVHARKAPLPYDEYGVEAIIIDPPKSDVDPVPYLHQFLKNESSHTRHPLLLPSGWVLSHSGNTEFNRYIKAKTGAGPALETNPMPSTPTSRDADWMVLVLILLWGSLAAHYNFNPLYRRSLFRYFRTHRFFLQDIVEWRIRSLIPGLVLMLQHALLFGVLLQALAQYFLSADGHIALSHHFSWIILFGDLTYRYFFLGSLLALLVELLQLLWLFLPNKVFSHLSQVMLLFSWPLQINFITATTATTLLFADQYVYVALFMAAGFIVFWLVGFLAAATDCVQKMRGGKGNYLFWTVALKLLIISGLAGWFFYSSTLYEVLSLALHLS